jgi:hypothetical protein
MNKLPKPYRQFKKEHAQVLSFPTMMMALTWAKAALAAHQS